MREGEAWLDLNHPNVLPFLGILETNSDLYFVSPYVKNGSLSDYVGQTPNADRQKLVRMTPLARRFQLSFRQVRGSCRRYRLLACPRDHSCRHQSF